VWVESASEPDLVKVANIQHLGTPIHAQLSEPRSAIELAGVLHPTPAVGGEPRERALAAIAELEDLDRGWYAGPVGWMDATEDGEFCVAIRSALLRDRTAHLFAGNGIVGGSDPEAELAETEVKLGALLPLLAG
jgi:salicylate biosynthesis isochorismate synthase/menaquinone-specific isochorismate synthase